MEYFTEGGLHRQNRWTSNPGEATSAHLRAYPTPSRRSGIVRTGTRAPARSPHSRRCPETTASIGCFANVHIPAVSTVPVNLGTGLLLAVGVPTLNMPSGGMANCHACGPGDQPQTWADKEPTGAMRPHRPHNTKEGEGQSTCHARTPLNPCLTGIHRREETRHPEETAETAGCKEWLTITDAHRGEARANARRCARDSYSAHAPPDHSPSAHPDTPVATDEGGTRRATLCTDPSRAPRL